MRSEFADWDRDLPQVLGHDPYADLDDDDEEDGEEEVNPLLSPASPQFDPDRTLLIIPPAKQPEPPPPVTLQVLPGQIAPEPPDPTETHLWTGTGEKLDMSETEARHTINAIRGSELRLQSLLMDLHDRNGWKALRYESWEACLAAEFDITSKSHYYYLQKIGSVYQTLLHSGMFEHDDLRKVKNSHLATLSVLPPERQAEGLVLSLARADAKEYGGLAALTMTGKLTDKIVRQVVEEMQRPTNTQIAEKRASTKPVEATNPLQGTQSSTPTPVTPPATPPAATPTPTAATVAPAPTADPVNRLEVYKITYDRQKKEFTLSCRSASKNEWQARLPISRLRAVLLDAGENLEPERNTP